MKRKDVIVKCDTKEQQNIVGKYLTLLCPYLNFEDLSGRYKYMIYCNDYNIGHICNSEEEALREKSDFPIISFEEWNNENLFSIGDNFTCKVENHKIVYTITNIRQNKILLSWKNNQDYDSYTIEQVNNHIKNGAWTLIKTNKMNTAKYIVLKSFASYEVEEETKLPCGSVSWIKDGITSNITIEGLIENGYIQEKVEYKVGDWVVPLIKSDNGNCHNRTVGVAYQIYRVDNKGVTIGVGIKDGNGYIYLSSIRKATQEEIDAVAKIKIGDYDAVFNNETVSFGCKKDITLEEVQALQTIRNLAIRVGLSFEISQDVLEIGANSVSDETINKIISKLSN